MLVVVTLESHNMIEFFLGIFVGVTLLSFFNAIRLRMEIKELDNLLKQKIESIKEKIIPSRIEEENGILYLYNKETNEFLGQGKTFTDLEKNVREKFPNKLFNVPQEELNKYE